MMHDLRTEIQVALNKHSAENASNTPDFILAGFLESCLRAFDAATQEREAWHGMDLAEPSTCCGNTGPCTCGEPDDDECQCSAYGPAECGCGNYRERA